MIETTLKINFDEYLSFLDDDGELKAGYEEHAECCLNALNKAINEFLADADTVAHHGLNLNNGPFNAILRIAEEDGLASLIIHRDGNSSASFLFELTTDLVLNKSHGLVSISAQ